MSFNWEKYLILAEDLYECPLEGSEEACFRSAISRSYYAAFCKCRNYAVSMHGYAKPDTNVHRDLINFYNNFTAHAYIAINNNLSRLLRKRVSADYDDEIRLVRNKTIRAEAKISIEWAKEIINAIDRMNE